MELKEIKLVIWDLDETFWNGVLSDHNESLIQENIELIHNMVDAGVMCSICSKNDEEQVKRVLEEANIWDLFVFKSINWTPKGQRIKQIIDEMGLREVNVLFLDDNPSNRAEAISICPHITVKDEKYIKILIEYFNTVIKRDKKHDRLNQYKLLEEKKDYRASVGSNEEFLIKSNIIVEMHNDCINHIERIYDLIQRSNQLNFTKNRCSITELNNLLNDNSVLTGYVKVKDNFGDYGIVGFYAVQNNTCIHLVFSCRTLNMGVEQYIYQKIGKPILKIVGDVSSDIEQPNPYWINMEETKPKNSEQIRKKGRIIFKGPCDMSQIASYINCDDNIISEMTYVNKHGVSIEGHNHTSHIIQSLSIDKETQKKIINSVPFGDDNMYSTSIFNDDVKYVFFSLFTDPNLGMYKDKKTGVIVAFGEYTNDLTDENNWVKAINQEFFTAGCQFSIDQLKALKDQFVFIGRMQPDQVLENLKIILSQMNRNAILILNLGSEIPYEKNTQEAYIDRENYNKELNALVRKWANNEPRVKYIDTNEFITGQECFTNNINHFHRKVYYMISKKLVEIINSMGDEELSQIPPIEHEYNQIVKKIRSVFSRIHHIIPNKKDYEKR